MEITLKGTPVNTSGVLPEIGSEVKNFVLVRSDLTTVSLKDLGRKKKLLNVFPSIDTGTCAASVKAFYEKISGMDDVVACNISKDLPFAMGRHCGAASLKNENLIELSDFRGTFAKDYGLQLIDSALRGLCSRAVIVLNADNQVVYTEQVAEITKEPNYEKALAALL